LLLPQVTLFCAGKLPPASKKAKKKAKAKPGKVIVVGAGPAGLAAALHLKVHLSPELCLDGFAD
jgi:NADPH-dependent 2,4-dienoyl-CoA reductase/sulfur reductase-like enzyme